MGVVIEIPSALKQYVNDQIDYLTETGQTDEIQNLLDWQNK